MANTNRSTHITASEAKPVTNQPREGRPPQPPIAQGKNGFVPQNAAPATTKVPVLSAETGHRTTDPFAARGVGFVPQNKTIAAVSLVPDSTPEAVPVQRDTLSRTLDFESVSDDSLTPTFSRSQPPHPV